MAVQIAAHIEKAFAKDTKGRKTGLIRFMGLIDPVKTGLGDVETTIGDIVKTLWIGVKDESKGNKNLDRLDKTIFITTPIRWNGKVHVDNKYPVNHAASGFVDMVKDDIVAAAKKAGMKFAQNP